MKLTIYKIFSFLLIPVAVMFILSVIIMLAAALQNLAVLLPVLIIACVAVYSFTALNFLIRGIDGKKHLGKRSKYLLKGTAIVSGLFVIMIVSQCIILLLHPEVLQQLVSEVLANFKGDFQIDKLQLENYLRAMSYFFIAYGAVLGMHIIFSFQQLEMYNYLFQDKQPD